MCTDGIVGNAYSYPHGSFAPLALADHFQNPDFVLIGNAKTFATAVIAKFFYQIGHNVYGLTSCFRTLESHIDQATVVHDTIAFSQFGTSAPCRLRNSYLMFVHIADHIIGMRYFRNESKRFVRVPFDDLAHRSFGPVTSSPVVQLTIECM